MAAVMLKAGFAIFVVLAAAVTANVLMLQPAIRRAPAPVPATAVMSAEGEDKAAENNNVAEREASAAQVAKDLDLEAAVRRELQNRGYAPGEGDFTGYEARAAILAFESDAGLPLNGTVRPELLQHLLFGVARGEPQPVATPAEVSSQAREVIAAAQRALIKLGYKLEANGLPSLETQRAIRDYELANKLPETGRVSGRLMRKLLGAGASDSPPATADRLRARVAS